MKFTTPLGSFQLSIKGYRPSATNWRERNNLLCEVSTDWQRQHDTQSAPLQTWEVHRLLGALRNLYNRAANHVAITFAEPGLSLDGTALPDERYRLQIQLDHALTPAWHRYPDFPLEMDMTLNRKQLQDAIQDLSGQLAHYPER